MSKNIILGKGRKVILEEMMDKNTDYLEELRIKERFFARQVIKDKNYERILGQTQREIKETIDVLDFIKEIYKEEYE